MNILFLTARFPYPVVGGDRLKPYHLIRYLAKDHNLTLISFYQGDKIPQDYLKAMNDLKIDARVLAFSALKGGLRTIPGILHYPLEIAYYYDKKFAALVDDILKEKKIDLAFSFFMRTAEYLKDKKLPKILIAEDCRTLYQKRSCQRSRNIIQKLVRFWEYKMLAKYEPRIIEKFDRVTLVSNQDIQAMKIANPNAQYRLLSNGTDVEHFSPDYNIKRNGIIFAGKLDVWANQLMISNIVNNIMPIIWNELPEAKLNIVGADPPKSVLSLRSENISVIPNVPDMIDYLRSAELFLHPHNGGSGIQNKLLEAMSAGCPVVTTPTGNQGIDGKHELELMIGDNDFKLAKYAIKILKDKDFAKLIAHNARKLIISTHSWDKIFKDLDSIINELVEL